MFQDILKKVDGRVSEDRVYKLTEEVWLSDRYFTYSGFQKTMKLCAARMQAFGAETEVGGVAADGKTLVGDWMMPLAWDAEFARLSLVEAPGVSEGRKIIEYPETNTALVMWSAPTAEGGVTAELVWVPDSGKESSYEGVDLEGKVLLADVRASAVKKIATDRGAVGVVSMWLPRAEDQPDGVFWNNAFPEAAGGWGALADEKHIWGFGVSPNEGKRLAELCEKGTVKVHAEVKSRLYDGEVPWATGLIPGETDEEVMLVGHACEQGANDNASGVACMIESMNTLKELIDAGELPRPRRGLRAVIISECYSLLGFAAAHPEIMKRTVAGTNLDCVGEKQPDCLSVLPIHLESHSSAAFVDALWKAVADGYLPKKDEFFAYQISRGGPGLGDSMYSDPAIGVPCLYVGAFDRYWHTCNDTIDKVDPHVLAMVTVMSATWMYFIANAGLEEALWMAQLSAADGCAELASQGTALIAKIMESQEDPAAAAEILADARERLDYTAWWRSNEVFTTASLVEKADRKRSRRVLNSLKKYLRSAAKREAKRIERAAKAAFGKLPGAKRPEPSEKMRFAGEVTPVRSFIGSLTFDSIPPAEREGRPSPRWDDTANSAVFWSDGRRTLAEVIRLTRLETGSGGDDLVDLFKFLEKHGLVELRNV